MKRLVLFCFLVFSSTLFGQKSKLKAYLDFKQFHHPESGNYIEVHLQFAAYSVIFKPQVIDSTNGLIGELAVSMRFKKNGEIVKSDAYRLQTPFMKDSIIEDFYEIKRFALSPGSYTFELDIMDLNNEKSPISAIQEIEITDISGIGLSDIEVAEMAYKSETETVFTKSGYDIIPRISTYYGNEDQKIPVYFEVYTPPHQNENIRYGIQQKLIDKKTGIEIDRFSRISKVEQLGIQPIIRVIDISTLISGDYQLEFSIISNNNTVLGNTKYEFERYKEEIFELVKTDDLVLDPTFQLSITDDSIAYYMESLIPICNPAEIKNVLTTLKTKDKTLCRKYIQSFWVNSTNNQNTYESWMKYKQQVQIVQKLFGNNFMEGFETDRGRVYLQYGAPSNVITKEVSSTEVPYEVWRYDRIGNMSNRRFIFYNPDLVNNAYRLLHSDVRGEIQNARWQQYLQKRNSYNKDVYDNNDGVNDFFGGQGNELFNQY